MEGHTYHDRLRCQLTIDLRLLMEEGPQRQLWARLWHPENAVRVTLLTKCDPLGGRTEEF